MKHRIAAAKRLSYWILALGVAAPLLYYSLRGIAWREVWRLLGHTAPAFLVLSFLVATISLLLRALRWRLLLVQKTSKESSIGFVSVFAALSVGYCGNLFLPARAGELVRTLMVSSATRLSKAFVLTTAICESASDAVALVLISSVVLLSLPVKPGWFAHAAVPFAAAGIAAVLMVALLPKLGPAFARWLDRAPVSAHLRQKAQLQLAHVLEGLRTLHSGRLLLSFVALTALIWLLDSLTAILAMRALALPTTLATAFLLTTGLALASALPSTPGYVGIYQFVAVSVLVPFGFSKTDAIGYILLFQALQYALMIFWAACATLAGRARLASAREAVAESVERSA
jgi:uncharacterized protein (TIRG00374 family)